MNSSGLVEVSLARARHGHAWIIAVVVECFEADDTRGGVEVRQDRWRWSGSRLDGRGPRYRGPDSYFALRTREQAVVGPAGAQGLFVVRRGGQGRASIVAVNIVVIQLEVSNGGDGVVARRALAFDQRGHAFGRCGAGVADVWVRRAACRQIALASALLGKVE